MKKDVTNRFYKIITAEGASEATILMYDYIGEIYEFDYDEGRWKQGGVTDIEFVQELNRLAALYQVINIRINSPGGDFFHGNAIITAIQSCRAEIHTWNDGLAASMAADIWLCGHKRHMAKNAMLMIHPVWNVCMGHAQDMRECAEQLDKLTESAIIATATSTGISEDEIRSRYYADYKDHWLTYTDAVTDGLVTETGDNYTAADVQKNIEGMTYKQLVEHFEKSAQHEGASLLDSIKTMFQKRLDKISGRAQKVNNPPSTSIQTNALEMNLEDFKKSITDGTLSVEAVTAHLDTLQPANPAAPDKPAEPEDSVSTALKSLKEELAALKTDLSAAKARIEEYGSNPGASKATPGMPSGDPAIAAPAADVLKAFNEQMKKSAEDGLVPYRPQ